MIQARNISVLALINNTIIDSNGLKIGIVKDLIFTSQGHLLYIIVAIENVYGSNIYYCVPFQLFSIRSSFEQVVFFGDINLVTMK